MQRIPFFVLLLSLIGCASASMAKDPRQLPAENANAGNVTRALELVLDRGDAVKVSVECITSYDGMTAGYRPEDYGCEDDNDAIVESEKFLLREVLGKYARFSIDDGSTPAVPPAAAAVADDNNVSDPAADEAAADSPSAIPPADEAAADSPSEIPPADEEEKSIDLLSGTVDSVTHRIVIEVRNHFSRESGTTICHYNEKRQLQSVQDENVIAFDRFNDSKTVEYRPSSRGEVTIGSKSSKSFSFEKGNSPYVSRVKERESGGKKYYMVEAAVEGVSTVASRTPETTASTRSGIVQSSSREGAPRLIPGKQLVRILRQRSQNLHDMSDQEVLDRFFELCPEAKDRIIVADPAQ